MSTAIKNTFEFEHTYSSIYIPKDPDFFRRERKLILQRTMQVLEPRPNILQADLMSKELEACDKREYTERTLPILLHQVTKARLVITTKMRFSIFWIACTRQSC